jgi:hypothetical protein
MKQLRFEKRLFEVQELQAGDLVTDFDQGENRPAVAYR